MAKVVSEKGSHTTPHLSKSWFYIVITFLLGVCFVASGCNSGTDEVDNSDRPSETADSTQGLSTVVPTEMAEESEEIVVDPSPVPPTPVPVTEDAPVVSTESAPVPTVVAEEEGLTFSSDDYYMSASYAIVAENLEAAAEGQELIVVTANLGSNSYATTMVEEGTLVFIGNQGELYKPEDVSDEYQPYLVGSQIPSGGSVYGFVIFNLPEGLEEGILEWCPEESHPCSEPLQAVVSGIP